MKLCKLRLFRLVAVSLLGLSPARGLAQANAEARGERALRASLYLNLVPALIDLGNEGVREMLTAIDMDSDAGGVVKKALEETWTENRIYARASAAIEKELPPDALDAAIHQMTPEVQDLIRAGIAQPTREQLEAWLKTAAAHPDKERRAVLARRIVRHVPKPDRFRAIMNEGIDLIVETTVVASGHDALERDLHAQVAEAFESLLAVTEKILANEDVLLMGAVGVYRDQPTSRLQLLADALDSEAGRELQRVALDSLLTGVRETRVELVARIQSDLKAAKER